MFISQGAVSEFLDCGGYATAALFVRVRGSCVTKICSRPCGSECSGDDVSFVGYLYTLEQPRRETQEALGRYLKGGRHEACYYSAFPTFAKNVMTLLEAFFWNRVAADDATAESLEELDVVPGYAPT